MTITNKQKENKIYDLEERTLEFAKKTINICRKLPKEIINSQLIAQIIRSSGSVGANYREANEALSKKDFSHRMKITRKECKETSYWLELLKQASGNFNDGIISLSKESNELRNIFTSIINKTK